MSLMNLRQFTQLNERQPARRVVENVVEDKLKWEPTLEFRWRLEQTHSISIFTGVKSTETRTLQQAWIGKADGKRVMTQWRNVPEFVANFEFDF